MPTGRTPELTDEARRAFLDALDDAYLTVTVSEWESDFLESTYDVTAFSPAQRGVIARLIARYGSRVNWVPQQQEGGSHAHL